MHGPVECTLILFNSVTFKILIPPPKALSSWDRVVIHGEVLKVY